MTELERQLLGTVERLEKDSREREEKLTCYLNEVERHLSKLGEQYGEVLKYLKSLR